MSNTTNYDPPDPHQSRTPTPLQSFTKSFISFSKALILFFLVTHVYMILFLVIPNKGYGAGTATGTATGISKVQVVSNTTTKPESGTSVPPSPVELQPIVVKKKEPTKPKERPIEIQTVIVKKVRDELTQEQLQRIHAEFQNELSSSSSSSGNNNNGKNEIIDGNIYNQRINTLQKLLEKVTHTRNFNKQIIDKTNAILEQSKPSKLFDPKIQSLMKISMHRVLSATPMGGGERKVQEMKDKYDDEQVKKIKIDSLVSFLKRDGNYRDMEVDQLKNEILKPIEEEFETLLEMYGNGEFGINDIENAFAFHNIDLNSYNEKKCDRKFLKIDPDLYGPNIEEEDEEEENIEEEVDEKEEEEDPEDGIFATKNHLMKYVETIEQDLEKYFSEALAASGNEYLNIVIRNEKDSTLKEKAFETLRQRFNHASQHAKSKFDSLFNRFRSFQSSIDNYRRYGIANDVRYDENEICTQLDEVEDIMMFALKYVERLGMEVNDAIRLIITNFNQQNSEDYHIDYDEINMLPEVTQPEYLNNFERRGTFKELMNTPIVPASLKSLNQGVDIISGYSDALDRLIDFIAGLSKSENNGGDDEEEGTIGESIETGLVRMLNNFNMPKQLSKKHGKAGILR
jgi:hypothetical protein